MDNGNGYLSDVVEVIDAVRAQHAETRERRETKLDRLGHILARGKRDMSALDRLASEYNLGNRFDAEVASRSIEEQTLDVLANELGSFNDHS